MDNRNTRVLIVDDQQSIYVDFQEMLSAKTKKRRSDEILESFTPHKKEDQISRQIPSYDLSYASSGEQACDMVKTAYESNRPYAVAYIDIRMPPGMDGVETIRHIRQFEKNLEIVIMTAYTDKPIHEIVLDMELLDKLLYIRKPVAYEEIQQITRSLVEKWNLEQTASRRKRELFTSHQRLKTALDVNLDAIGLFGGDGKLVYANQPWRELFHLSEDELEQLSPEDISARLNARLREAEHSSNHCLDHSRNGESIMEEVNSGASEKPRFFHRLSVPLDENETPQSGNVVSYHDMSRDLQIQRMKAEILSLRRKLPQPFDIDGIIGSSAPMQRVFERIHLAAESDITVLIQGESGTGKELVARAVHAYSARKNKPFVAVNCAAIPESLIESELFGHERGAFTGATANRIGKFEEADGGTIFLDEIGDMPTAMQAKLLRVLQDKQIQRIGSAEYINLDFRIITATNRDIKAEIKAGNFREDLFYRVAAFPISVPPLRDRGDDVALLISHFLHKKASQSRERVDSIAPEALSMLMQYHFPGNVRELENIIECAMLFETSNMLQLSSLPIRISSLPSAPSTPPNPARIQPLDQLEREAISSALKVTDGNVSRAAHLLGIDRSTLHRKMKNPPDHDPSK